MSLGPKKFYDKEGCVITLTWSDIQKLTGTSKSTAQKRYHDTDKYEIATRVKQQHGNAFYTLSDGKDYTVNDIAAMSDISRNTIYYRLKTEGIRDLEILVRTNVKKRPWIDDEEVIIVAGIPLNPPYLDGVNKRHTLGGGTFAADRHGKNLSPVEATRLMHYREQQRKMWRIKRDA